MGAITIDSSAPLWAITSYFNPLRSVRRLANFKTFRRRLGARLLAVELSYDGRFELDDGDADLLLRVHGGDVLWQKERLLNLALRALPDECTEIAWLDADIVFLEPDWPERVSAALRQHRLVQVFDRLIELGPDHSLEGADAAGGPGGGLRRVIGNLNGASSRRSLTSGLRDGRFDLSVFGRIGGSVGLGYTPGHGWAARRSLLDRFDLYDTFILGSGDKAIAAAACGEIEPFIASLALHPPQAEHYRAWAVPVARTVDGSVGFSRNTILHLWHGDLAHRQYRTRYIYFREYGFDPSADLRLGESGAWRWGSAKPEMHQYVRRYLESRCEDGVPAKAPPGVRP